VRIKCAQCAVICSSGEESKGGKELTAFFWKGIKSNFKDVVVLLNEIEIGKIELTPTSWIGLPGIEISSVRKVIVDKASKDTSYKWMAVAMPLQIILNCL
jgi:hypothetical protein